MPPREKPTFGEELARLMKERNLTQQALAERLGIHQTAVSKLLLGYRNRPRADVVFRISDLFELPVEHWRPFLAGDPEPEPAAKSTAKTAAKKHRKK